MITVYWIIGILVYGIIGMIINRLAKVYSSYYLNDGDIVVILLWPLIIPLVFLFSGAVIIFEFIQKVIENAIPNKKD